MLFLDPTAPTRRIVSLPEGWRPARHLEPLDLEAARALAAVGIPKPIRRSTPHHEVTRV